MTAPVRIRLSRAKGWRLPENTVVVSRPGPWGNVFIVGKHGTAEHCVHLHETLLGGLLCLSNGPDLHVQQLAQIYAIEHIEDLRGKNLACWCRAGQPCHADTLIRVANREVPA